MCLALVRKDYKIIFRENFMTFVAQMIFILVIVSANLGIMGYSMLAVADGWYLLMNTCMADKNSSALAYLMSTPYSGLKIIFSKYLSAVLMFAAVSGIYAILSYFVRLLGFDLLPPLSVPAVCFTAIFYMLFISVTMPLYFFLQDMTVRIVSIFFILGVGFAAAILMRTADLTALIQKIEQFRPYLVPAGFLICTVFIAISAAVMKALFDRLEF